MNKPTITAVIPCRNKFPTIALLGLLQQTIKPEVVAISSGSFPKESHQILEYIGQRMQLVTVVNEHKTIGEHRAKIMNYISTDYTWLLDDDVMPKYDCLEEFLNAQKELKTDFFQGSICQPEGMVFPGEKDWDIITDVKISNLRNYGYELKQGDTANLFCKTTALQEITSNPIMYKLSMFEHTFMTAQMKNLLFVPQAGAWHLPSPDSFSRGLNYYTSSKELAIALAETTKLPPKQNKHATGLIRALKQRFKK